jgi:nitrate/nitrite transporter NarK
VIAPTTLYAASGLIFFDRQVLSVLVPTGTAGGIGGFLSSLVIGRVVQSISFTPVFIAAGFIYPICVIILLRTIKEIRQIDLYSIPLDVNVGVSI